MIVLLLAWYFLGGGVASGMILTSPAVDDLAKRAATLVEDETRRQAAVQALEILEKDIKAFEKAYAASGKALGKLYRNHGGGRDEALFILNDLNANWADGQRRALDARFTLRDQLTEEEWSALFGNSD
ncbi:MAG: hypothetical protein P8Y01_07670 [Woeseiaceae bacterium]|jgi:hypothetical protein